MNRYALFLAGCGIALLSGCGSGGIVFNGERQIDQFPVRKTPIIHFNLPSETDPVTGNYDLKWDSLPMVASAFSVLPFPGHDWWAMDMFSPNPGVGGGICSDNPTCRTPAEVPDWQFTHDIYKTPGPGWPNPNVTTSVANPANRFIAAWVLSLQNQWFLREPDGSSRVAATPGDPPVHYEALGFASMAISIHEIGVTTLPPQPLNDYTPALLGNPAIAPQQEVGDPATVGANNVARISVPVNNLVSFGYNGVGAPQGLLAAGWREFPAENTKIETVVSAFPGTNGAMNLVNVPVPDYFGGGGPISCGGGIFQKRFSDGWQQTTGGTSSTVNINDGLVYSYYLAAVANHVIGYGLGLIDSSFALPGVVDNEENIMNISVIFDLTAFIAAGKKFQFVSEDLLRMQDVVNGTFNDPGPKSTLPGKDRRN